MYQSDASFNGGRRHLSGEDAGSVVVGSLERYDRREQHISANVSTRGPLIRSKLSRPRVSGDVMPRPRLEERLNAGLSSKVTLLSAPAGSGKTTLLVEWLKTCSSRRGAWLSLDENDDEPGAFMHYLVAALQTVFSGACKATARLLKAREFPQAERVAIQLTNDLADLPEDVILVLDNYHAIHQSAIHALLDLVVRYMPPQAHLVLAARCTPPLPLAMWRAQGQLNELYGSNLRFTREEMEAFLTGVLGDELAREAAETLERQTEGWIAPLRLAALSLRGERADHAAFVERLRGGPDSSMSSYLLEDFLARYPQAIQQCFLRVSILDQFCAGLCGAMIADDDTHHTGQAYLDGLERSNVLIVSLDERQGWYRFHPLLKLFLEHRLRECISQEELAILHRQASAWYGARGYVEEGLAHALAAGDAAQAARLVEAQLLRVIEREQWAELERWLHLFPEEQIQGSPVLLVASAWLLEVRGQMEDIPRLLAAAEQLAGTGSRSATDADDAPFRVAATLIALLRSLFQYGTGQTQASLESARAALKWMAAGAGAGERYLANLALYCQALSSQLAGHEDVAHCELNRALREQPAHRGGTARLLFARALLYLHAGKLRQVEQTSQHFLRLAQEADLPVSQSWAHWLLGYVQYEWNRLDAAASHFSSVIANRQYAHHWPLREAMYGLALVYQARGLPDQAKEIMNALLEALQRQNTVCALSEAYSFQGHLALLQNETESAEQWVEMAGAWPVRGPMASFEVPAITRAWMLFARGDEGSVGEGHELLSELLCHVEAIHNTRKTIEVLALQALAYDQRGCLTQALDALERSVALGHAGGFTRTFADLPGLGRLLRELRRRGKARQAGERKFDAYLQCLLLAMDAMGSPAAADGKEELMRQRGLEPLTDRELHILRLLARDFTNKEIARELVIAAGTVKVHTINVYRKLSVNNRREAVALSRSLGLLPATNS